MWNIIINQYMCSHTVHMCSLYGLWPWVIFSNITNINIAPHTCQSILITFKERSQKIKHILIAKRACHHLVGPCNSCKQVVQQAIGHIDLMRVLYINFQLFLCISSSRQLIQGFHGPQTKVNCKRKVKGERRGKKWIEGKAWQVLLLHVAACRHFLFQASMRILQGNWCSCLFSWNGISIWSCVAIWRETQHKNTVQAIAGLAWRKTPIRAYTWQ